ncbi:RES family NAD+ phosphorylase [Pedobacter sp. GR22-6]|uniref:RES family NAD+ phosphorylase n=1 Tax=Pedobacter sp. GR22-6 TaxID=3127957 RepID=UPI00307CF4A2
MDSLSDIMLELETIRACSNCFRDPGLRLDAFRLGKSKEGACPNCGSLDGAKLSNENLEDLSHSFFVNGSRIRTDYGGAVAIQFNDYHEGIGDVAFPEDLAVDAKLIADILGVGFFLYGPRLWMVGEIEPLNALQEPDQRDEVIEAIMNHYPETILEKGTHFYRLRVDPTNQMDPTEYDSAPEKFLGSGRLDSIDLPILYGSFDIEACLHECRVTIEQELYLCNMKVVKSQKLLDLTAWPEEPGITEFESLSLAIHMVFRAPAHSYEIIRAVARAARNKGFDGILYPSYFSRIHSSEEVVKNIGLFGRPVRDGVVESSGVNRILLKKVTYDYAFGPGDF